MSEHKKTALVTGASSGLGAEFCRQLAKRCEVIIAVGRREERLHALGDELAGQVEFHPLAADLGTIEGVARCMESLRQQGPVDYLVNSAGFSTYGNFSALPIDEQRNMISVHCDATVTLCSAAVAFMRERGGGAIINVSSIGAFLPGAGFAVYGATKAFINFFSESLQAEVAKSGIKIQALCPGYIRTEFHLKMIELGFEPDRVPDHMWMEPSEVVQFSLGALANEQVVVVPGEQNQKYANKGLQRSLDKQLAVS